MDGAIVKISKNGDEVARVSNNSISISKHSVPAKDGSVVFKKAEGVNKSYPSHMDPPYLANSSPVEFQLGRDESLVRVFTDGVTFPNRSWTMKQSEIVGLTPAQIKDKFALDYLPNKITYLNIPAGTKVRSGIAAPRQGIGKGEVIKLKYWKYWKLVFSNEISGIYKLIDLYLKMLII